MQIDKSILFFIVLILYPIFEGLKDGYALSRNAKKYHLYGWITRALVSVCIIPAWYWVPLYCAYFWLVFDPTRNIAAGDPIFFVGSTSFLDKTFGSSIIYIKLALLIASIVFVVFKLNLI